MLNDDAVSSRESQYVGLGGVLLAGTSFVATYVEVPTITRAPVE